MTDPGTRVRARIAAPRYQIDQLQFLVRTNANPASVKAELQQAVRAADPLLSVRIRTIEERLEPLTGPLRIVS